MPAKTPPCENVLYYGDNLHILRKYIPDGSVDLVYIDPPFNSNINFNLLFKAHDGTRAAGQIKAFEDTWQWDVESDRTYRELTKRADPIAQAMYAFYRMLGASDMLAYLAMMAARLDELHRVLKPTGSMYVHCDPTASHYLKILLDAIFGPTRFRNEIIWKRTTAHSDGKRAGRIHDVLLFYTKGEAFTWNKVYQPYDSDYIERYYRYKDADGRRYASGDVAAAGPGPARYFNGVLREPPKDSHWRYSQENLDRLIAEGRIFFTANGFPRYKRYLDDMPGIPVQDIWADKDVQPVVSWSKEKEGYPTQKPIALLERIIRASTNEGDTVLDAFCGCGTTVAAAQKLERRWIGIDITNEAIKVIRRRLERDFGAGAAPEAIGQPQTLEDAQQLAKDSAYAFEDWALELVGAYQPGKKRGSDRGVDGRRVIGLSAEGKPLEMLVSVKSGKTGSNHVRDLRGTVEREGAALGLFLTLQEPTKAMKDEALAAGPCELPGDTEHCPRMQILTIKQLLAGTQPQFPAVLPVASPAQKPLPDQGATVTPFQRPLAGAAIVDVSKPPTARPERLRTVAGARKRSAGD